MARKPRDFLPDVSLQHLKNLHRKEKNQKAKTRLQACILKKKKTPVPDIIDELSVPHATLYSWFRRITENGLDELYDRKKPGRNCALNEEQRNQLIEDFKASPIEAGLEESEWSGPVMKEYIKKEFDIDYNIRTVQLLYHRLGFSFKPDRVRRKSKSSKD